MSENIFATVDPEIGLEYMNNVQLQAEMLVTKWSKRPTRDMRTGKVEMVDWLNSERVGRWDVAPLKSDYAKLQMAMLLENQSKASQAEAGGALWQASYPTQTTNLALPTKFSLPIIRRIYAQIMQADWMVTQAMPGPTSYAFWLDFLNASSSNNTNILSVEYNFPLSPENGVPGAGQMQLTRATITALKQIIGVTWSTEAQEDAMAQLGLDVEQELINAFSEELARNVLARNLQAIQVASVSGTAQGASLVAPWAGPNTQHQFAGIASLTITDYKQSVFATLVDADTDFQRANRTPSDGIVCGYGLAGFLQKINTATQSQAPTGDNTSFLGITDYGTFAGRWRIWGTDLINDQKGFLYKRNPTPILASHIYAPYRPIEVMPAVYAEYDTTTGAYTNTDKWTRNIRERSGYLTTKSYGFQPILAPATGLSQY